MKAEKNDAGEIQKHCVNIKKYGIRDTQNSGTDEDSKGFDSKEGFL